MEKASEIDNDWRAYQEENKNRNSIPKKAHNPSSSSTKTTTTSTIAMNRLTAEERTKCLKEGLCFRCRQKGHNASDTKFHPDARPRAPPNPAWKGQSARNRCQETDTGGDSDGGDESEGERATGEDKRAAGRRTTATVEEEEAHPAARVLRGRYSSAPAQTTGHEEDIRIRRSAGVGAGEGKDGTGGQANDLQGGVRGALADVVAESRRVWGPEFRRGLAAFLDAEVYTGF